MRRSTASCEAVANLHKVLARAVALLSTQELEARVAVLEPLVTEARRERLRRVTNDRVGSITLLLDSLHDPFNGAAVIRSCDVFGVPTLHVIERGEPFFASTTVSRGSEKWVDVVAHGSAQGAVDALVGEGFELIAAEPDGELSVSALGEERGKIALVLGNERDGIALDVRRRCARSVVIPMRGFAESLNVSVTTAILLHELTRGRPGDLPPLERSRRYLRGLLQTIERSREVLEAADLPIPAPTAGT